jgi:hypothetical protein
MPIFLLQLEVGPDSFFEVKVRQQEPASLTFFAALAWELPIHLGLSGNFEGLAVVACSRSLEEDDLVNLCTSLGLDRGSILVLLQEGGGTRKGAYHRISTLTLLTVTRQVAWEV